MNLRRKIFILGILFLMPVYLRTLYESRMELATATNMLQQGEVAPALSHLRKSLSWWSPGNFYALRAKENLEMLFADETLQTEERIMAGRALYEGLMSGRNIFHDNLQERTQIKERIFDLNPKLRPELKRANRTEVHYGYQLLAQLGFWGWMCSVLFLIIRGFTPQGDLQRKNALWGLASVLGFFFLWLFALTAA